MDIFHAIADPDRCSADMEGFEEMTKHKVEVDVIRRDKKSRPFDGTCENCKYFDDPEEVCKMRLCIHAIRTLFDCYDFDGGRE